MVAALDWAARVELWDGCLAAAREYLRGEGLREVSTPVRVPAVAVEPYIEPLAAERGLLRTSPELAMKRLLARGGGPMFQIGACFRKGERGDRHAEEFHLVEWYRLGHELGSISRDVERLVAVVFETTSAVLKRVHEPPRAWKTVAFLDLLAETSGVALTGDEDVGGLRARLEAVSSPLASALTTGDDATPDEDMLALRAWSELFTAWSDTALQAWLDARRDVGIHIVEFPAPLAALSECEPETRIAHRFESYVGGVELANGYRELRDPGQQRRRFERVNRLRALSRQPALAIDQSFVDDLGSMPPCVGAALGLERLLMLASAADHIDAVCLVP